MSERNRLSSLNILACSSHSAHLVPRLPPNLGLRQFRLGHSGLNSVSFEAEIPFSILSTGRLTPSCGPRQCSVMQDFHELPPSFLVTSIPANTPEMKVYQTDNPCFAKQDCQKNPTILVSNGDSFFELLPKKMVSRK